MKRKQIISLLLTLLMLFSSLPIPAYAEWYDEETGNEDYSGTVVSASDAIVIPDWDDFSGDDASDSENENDWEEWDEYADFSGEESDETEDDPFWFDEEQPDVWETWEEPENEESPDDSPVLSLKETIDLYGYAYVLTKAETKVYDHPNRAGEPFFLLTEEDAILLATEYRGQGTESVKVWFIGDELFTGYISLHSLKDEVLTDEEVDAYTGLYWWNWAETEAGTLYAFAVAGYATITSENDVWDNEWETEINADDESDSVDAALAPDPSQSEADEYDELTEDEAVQEENGPDDPEVTVGNFLFVTTKTRAFSDMDDTWRDNANGDFYMGVFVKDADVQVDAVKVDSTGRMWYQVAFLYGDDFADGTMKWTEIGIAYVLPDETALTDAEDMTVTDIALPETPKASGRRMLMKAAGTTPMNGFTLKSINAPIPPLYAGQTGVYGSSGHDSDYKQIASLSGKGAIYATPHYLDGYTVYCLEHNLPGPGEGSGSSQQPKGPYVIVDIDTYMNTPGSSRVIYSDQTMHAIAWVLRHTYPFMVLDRSDSDNETWSRVAGQFAIRQVIREMEGAQYVRDYWNMDNFYVASGQAPAVYLEYARWLAANGIARGNITGYISIADKSIAKIGEYYVGTVTLYTDADLLRIPRSGATITGNTLGSDSSYYYLNNGDTIQITSSVNGFSIMVESVNSDENEASFLVGVPSAAIQKVLIPTHGTPYKLQSTTLFFELEIKYGSLIVTKLREGSQQTLAGATFQLYDSSMNAYGDPVTTDANGRAEWTNLPYGTYYVGEVGAPVGYQVNIEQLQVTIGGDASAVMQDTPIIGSVRFVKKQAGTEIPLIGARYELVTKSGSTYKRAVSAVDGSELPVLTTDANGAAIWSNVVEYGTYYIHEVQAPEGYLLDDAYYPVSVTEQNKIVSADVEDGVITAKIKIAKTDGLTHEPLAGVEFTLTRLSGPESLNGAGVGEVAAIITTDANGYAETDWLAWGRFKIEETKAPSGYTNIHYSTEIEAYEDGKTYTINVENVPSAGYIRLTKTDANSHAPLKGVQFDIYQGDKLISTMTTDVNGVALSGPLTKGTYIVREHGNPEGYTGELVTLPATVVSDQTTELAAENKPIQFTVKIIKKDSMTHEPLAGAEFTITRKESGVVVATLTTDSNGEATSGLLRYGEYEIKETKVPANYIDSGFTITVNGTEHGKTYVIEADNQPMQGGIRITKTDKLDGSPIAGVIFDIYKGTTKVGSMTTNASGVAVSGELPKGNYTVKERGLPEGYTGALVSLDCVVKSNEVTELKAENQPIQFRIKIVKTDSLTKEPLSGAEFSIIRTDNGETVEVLTTNSRGEAVSGLLRYGKYEVKETKFPANYMDNPFSVTMNGTEDGKIYEIQAENQPMAGGIRVIKTDKLDGSPISGVVFDIYQGSTLVGSMTTNTSGVAVSGELPKGNYTVKEHGLPEGYTGDLVSLDCVVKSNETTELKAENLPIQFKVKIVKTDGLTQEPVSGAEFTITRKDTGEAAATLTTDKNGIAVSDLLRYGEYTVTETKIPAHYAESTFSTTVTGTEHEKVYEIRVENEPTKGQIRLVKTDALDGMPISGVIFDIYDGDKLVSSMKTNENGVAVSDPLPKGNYTVKEHENPEGYVADLVALDCAVKSDEVTELKAENTPIQFRIRILKTDALTHEPLSGAEFTVKRVSGLPSHGSTGNGEIVATLVTDENGEAETGLLTWGEYEVTETKVPENFIDSQYSETVTGTENDKTYTLTVENEPMKGLIRLTKTDRLDGHPIAGVVFDILQEGKIITTMTTDADGVAVSEPIPKGKYTVKERANPTGYINDLYCVECEVFSDVTTRMNADNQPIQGKIQITKKDELTKTLLAGAEFTITRVTGLPSHNGEGNGETVAVLTTDNSGKAVSPLLTWGTYKVEETRVPEHYVYNHFFAMVVVKDNEKTYEITAENEPTKGWIELIKTDALDRTPIAGVQFDIYENDEFGSGLAGSMTTDENGVAKSPALRKGKYLVKEHENPSGYVSDLATVECTVKSDETTHTSAANQPIQGKIRIIKTDELTKEALAGAEFTITRISGLPSHNGSNNGEVVAEITTDADGVAVMPLLTWGVYRVEETGVPAHYVDNHFSKEVVIDTEDLLTYDVPCENEPTKGWIRLTKTDRKTGNPISGVQFDIYYNDQYGEGLAATMTTGEDGVALSEPLRKGKYIIKEHGETPGYLFEEITLECTVKSDEFTDLTATNQPIMTRLKLYKRDKDEYKKDLNATPGTRGDGVLTGTVYTVRAGEDITDRQGNVLYEKGAAVQENLKTSGEEASVLTDELWPGVYEIVEVTPPTGYQMDETPVRVDTTTAAQQSTETVMTYTGVNTNEVLYGRYAFVKFYGDNQVHDEAGLIEKPEADAVFHVYLKSAGSYEAARKFERDTITTDKNGKAQTKLLPYGIYTVEQVKGKKGYAIKAPFDIFIRGTEDPNDPPTMIINNEAIHYRLKFIKIDAETGNTITAAHTSFKLKDSEGNYVTQTVYYPNKTEIDTFTTDETGEVTLPETLIYGLYFAEEFEAPEGYLITTHEIPVFVGDDHFDQPGEAYLLEYKVENEPVKGRILLEKKGLRLTGFEEKMDGFGNTYFQPVYEEKYLTGAVFEVHAAEDVIGKDGTLWYHTDELVDTITTTAEGKDASKVLPLGKYHLVETAAPDGYIFSGERYEANLEYSDDHTALVEITVEAHNDYLPVSVSLEKEMEIMEIVHGQDGTVTQTVGTAPGKGFVFGLYNDKDIHYDGGTLLADTLVATGVTNEDGKLTFSGVYPHGQYYIKELFTMDGWKLNPNFFPVDLNVSNKNSDNMISVTLPDPVKNDLIYTHVTLTKTNITGQQTVPGALIEVTDSEGNVIYRAYTDENGEIPDIPVTPGRYTFREILAPQGYELNTAEMSFSVDKDGNVTGDTVIRDDYTRFYLLKLDESGRPLPGVEFGLVNGAGDVLFTSASDEKGTVTFEKIPYGTYSIVETNPLPGYIPDKTSVQITLDGTFVNPTLPLATIVNQPNTVWLKKVDQDGQPLAGAEFAFCNEYGERVQTAVSDWNGVVRFNRIPYGNYSIREIIAPNGYLLSRDVISLTVDKDFVNSEEPIATITNHLKRLKYIKVDTSGKYLPGVEFTLINAATGEEVETVVSNEKGEFTFTAFDYGVWIIRETKAPDGYNLMEDLTVSVDSDWVEPEPFTCVNIPDYFVFVKTDGEGNPLTGVKFTLEDSEGNILRDLVSAEGGVVFIPGLTPGTYLIREVETLEGYTVSSDPIQVVIDEHYTIPDEMPTFINYPTIQTGAGIEMTPIMWAGVGVAGAALLLGIGLVIKRKKRTYKK